MGAAGQLINTQGEGVGTKRTWKKAFAERRCLIPANGFFEWQKVEGQKQKLKHRIRRRDGQPFAFAGLWEVSTGGRDDVEALRCTIITTKPNEVCRAIHSRMPAILDPDEYDGWLDPTLGDGTLLLRPCPDEWLEVVRVGRQNSAKMSHQCHG